MKLSHLFMPSRPIPLGSTLPDLTLPDQDASPVALARIGGSGWLLVYFYPKAGTPGCTAQGCALRDAWQALTARGVRVFGVSRDRPEGLRRFRETFRLPFPLLSDSAGDAAQVFGVGMVLGFPLRQSFLFRDGLLVWSIPAAGTRSHAEEVLAALSKIS